jgi:3-oxoacyl-[acyl-carrier-protein] synthase-1
VHASEGRLPATYDFQSQHALDGILEVIRVRTGTRGPAFVVSTACSSSGKVFGSAQRLLASGVADAALVGGVDTLCQTTLRGFASLDALSSRPCRPFSSARDGTSLGEGAAFILLEREGDGPARLVGVGESSDAHHMSHPHPEGLGAVLAMSAALRAGAVEPSEIDYVNAHGTGTKVNDAVEARAIAEVLGSETPVTSTKGFTGHLLGAAGATEAVFSLFTLESGVAPASLGATPLDPAVSVRVLTTATRGRFRRVLSNSFGFGGSNVAIVFEATP